jgi:hypothetical protein
MKTFFKFYSNLKNLQLWPGIDEGVIPHTMPLLLYLASAFCTLPNFMQQVPGLPGVHVK